MAIIMVTMVMVVVSDGGTNHLVTDEQSNGFPEVPKAAFDGFPGLHAFGQSAKHEQAESESDHLQHHEFGDLQTEDFRKWEMQSAWQLKEAKVANMMERIA